MSSTKVLSTLALSTSNLERCLGFSLCRQHSRSLWTGSGHSQSGYYSCSNSNPTRKLRKLLTRRSVQPICLSVRHHNFDGEAFNKTNISLLTEEDESHNYVTAFSTYGLVLNSGFRVLGPCVLFPRAVLSWNVGSAAKITPESLSLFYVLEPKPDVLIIGKGNWDAECDPEIISFLKSKGINCEILATEQACATFNFLNSERRVVVAAIIPPAHLDEQEEFVFGGSPTSGGGRYDDETQDEMEIRQLVDGMKIGDLSKVASKLASKRKQNRTSEPEEHKDSFKNVSQNKEKTS